MATLQLRNGSYRLLFCYRDRRHSFTLGRVDRREAELAAANVERVLLRIEQGLLSVRRRASDRRVRPPRRAGLGQARRSARVRERRWPSGKLAGALPRDPRQRRHGGEHAEDRTDPPRSSRRDARRRLLPPGLQARGPPAARRPAGQGEGARGQAAQPGHDPQGAGRLPRRLALGGPARACGGAFPNKGLVYPKADEKPPFQTLGGGRAPDRPGRPDGPGGGRALGEPVPHPARGRGAPRLRRGERHASRGSTRWSAPRPTPGRAGASSCGAGRPTSTCPAGRCWSGRRSGSKGTGDDPPGAALAVPRRSPRGLARRSTPAGRTSSARPGQVRAAARSGGPRRPVTRDEAHDHLRRTLAGSRWAVVRGWHVLRHSFASNCAAGGVDQRLIDEWMGHTTEAMRRRYRHLPPTSSSRRSARSSAEPRRAPAGRPPGGHP